ncbi:MAG: hypothetical protein ACKVPY_00555 [Paracoccaceae bacterium]
MNRNVIIGIVVVILAVGGYFYFGGNNAADTAAGDAATAMTDAAALLDPAKWDAAKVTAMIDGSSLDDAAKTKLKDLVTAAGSDAAKIGAAITEIKTALKI